MKALGYDFTSMYIGGGTTTIIEEELMETIDHARKLFPGIKEVSCETDPSEIDTPTFERLKGYVDRMSIGVQSFDDSILKFPSTNIDMIFGFRGQSLEMLQRDMDLLMQLNPRQITTYPLMVTSQTKRSVKGTIAAKGDELSDQYRIIMNTLGITTNTWGWAAAPSPSWGTTFTSTPSVSAVTMNASRRARPALSASATLISTRCCSTA